ncbi:hypothetical protein [Dictyobacter arantiisoli]|uniref:Uncharacterized protein n=1 Tax=Dictyobacter arantiisoli TaxID=2014874 RepID=A0A5A5TKL4_9CHLR|nr:hypothetical protein [Dictyobacter arantiisoli]GCF11599.1 hypothetical protein KDI_51630 [Dictyobacter arantiisoli]
MKKAICQGARNTNMPLTDPFAYQGGGLCERGGAVMSKQYDAAPSLPKDVGVQPGQSLPPKTFTLQRALAAAGICAPILFTIGFVMQGFLRTDLHLGCPWSVALSSVVIPFPRSFCFRCP